MSEMLTRAAWTVFSVAVGALLAQVGALQLIGVTAILAIASAVSRREWVQERFPFLRTEKYRLKQFYASCYALSKEFRRQRKAHQLEPWDEWAEKIRDWDGHFLRYFQTRNDWQPRWRKQRSPLNQPYSNWEQVTLDSIEGRLALIAALLAE